MVDISNSSPSFFLFSPVLEHTILAKLGVSCCFFITEAIKLTLLTKKCKFCASGTAIPMPKPICDKTCSMTLLVLITFTSTLFFPSQIISCTGRYFNSSMMNISSTGVAVMKVTDLNLMASLRRCP